MAKRSGILRAEFRTLRRWVRLVVGSRRDDVYELLKERHCEGSGNESVFVSAELFRPHLYLGRGNFAEGGPRKKSFADE